MKSYILLLVLLMFAYAADKEGWKSRTVYQLLTDRFARNDGQGYGCDNLGNHHLI